MMGIGYLFAGSLGTAFIALGLGVAAIATAAIGLSAVGGLLTLAAPGFTAFGAVDWGSVLKSGEALTVAGLGLGLFGASLLLAANPFALLSIWLLSKALGSLSEALAPLNDLSAAATSMGTLADGITRLNTAMQNLDTSNLDKLDKISSKLSSNTAAFQALVALNNNGTNNGNAGGGGLAGKELQCKFDINLKMNGRDLQNIIIHDTAVIK